VTAAIRDTVAAIQLDEEVSEAVLTQRLKLSKSTVHYRVTRAIAGGWLVNRETRKGHVARLVRAAPLPDVRSGLPSPEEVAARVKDGEDCSNGLIRTLSPDEPFEQDLSVGVTSTTATVFECSNSQGEEREPPTPPPEEEIMEWTA
jgi:hypothetical protein